VKTLQNPNWTQTWQLQTEVICSPFHCVWKVKNFHLKLNNALSS